MNLSGFTTEQLQAELARRTNPMLAGKDWYYKMNQAEDEENYRDWNTTEPKHLIHTVWIVHKRFWHMNHYMDDRSIESYVTMPPGMNETQESCFDFSFSYEEAEEMLQSFGYTPLPDDSFMALVNQIVEIDGVTYYIGMHADTPEIADAILAAGREMGPFIRVDSYKDWMRNLATSMDCVVDWYDEYSSGSSAFMMKKEVYESLPPELER